MTSKKRLTNVPVQLTSFIGREREVAEVQRLLSRTRLLTLTGAGGSGKTRLALQVAADLQNTLTDGVWLAEFAPLANPVLVSNTVASVFGVRESPGVPLAESLVDFFRGKDLLLVLDNCEHLVEACALLAERLLHGCPRLRLLATSREALAIPGEISFQVPTLTLPDPQHMPPLETLAQFEAIRLFVERAAAVKPGFRLTEENAQSLTKICQRLDGIPLAIELAAVRMRTMSPNQIAARLDDRFRILTAGSRTALARQKTLKAAIDWSYYLLSDKEQTLFRRLSVFAGGWTLEAAEGVCASKDLVPTEVADLLAHLIDKSLVLMEERGGDVRYRMLETVRWYAREMLLGASEAAQVRLHHLSFFMQLAEEAEGKLRSAEQLAWLNRLEVEQDNLRMALSWSLEKNEVEEVENGLRLSSALGGFWYHRGYLSEGSEWLAKTLANYKPEDTVARAKALAQAARLAACQRAIERAISYAEQSLSIYRRLQNKQGIAESLMIIGHARHYGGDKARAASLLEEGLALSRETGDRWSSGVAMLWLADTLLRQGDNEEAAALADQSLALFRELGDQWGIAFSLGNAGEIARRQGHFDRAAALLRESLGLHQLIGNKVDIPYLLEALAIVFTLRGQFAYGARLWGGAEAYRQAIHAPIPPSYQEDYALSIADARAKLGEQAFQVAWSEGGALSPEQAVDLALDRARVPAKDEAPAVNRVNPIPAPDLRVFALGPTRVFRGTQELSSSDWTYTKAREVFLFLMCFSARTKEQIGLALWPDATPSQLSGNIKITLYHLRRALGRQDWILFKDDQYSFNRSLNYWFDVEAFESSLAEARRLVGQDPAGAIDHLETAIGLYRGDFLDGWTTGEWFLLRQAELQREYTGALLMLGQRRFAQGQYSQAAEVYRKAIAVDSFLEIAHRELMRSLARQGDRGQALRHYQSLQTLLRTELDATPAPETDALYKRLRLGEEI